MRYSTVYKISFVLDDFVQSHTNISGKVGWATCSGRLGVQMYFQLMTFSIHNTIYWDIAF